MNADFQAVHRFCGMSEYVRVCFLGLKTVKKGKKVAKKKKRNQKIKKINSKQTTHHDRFHPS